MSAPFSRIVRDPAVCMGQPRVAGTRVTAAFVLRLLAAGSTPEQVVRDYPELCPEDIRQVMAFAAFLADERTIVPAA